MIITVRQPVIKQYMKQSCFTLFSLSTLRPLSFLEFPKTIYKYAKILDLSFTNSPFTIYTRYGLLVIRQL